jgi:hypothetical protein
MLEVQAPLVFPEGLQALSTQGHLELLIPAPLGHCLLQAIGRLYFSLLVQGELWAEANLLS